MRNKFVISAVLLLLLAGGWWYFAGTAPAVPKPRGYFRIALPAVEYRPYASECPLQLEVSNSAQMELFRDRLSLDSCWFNIYYPKYNARIHCTYMSVGDRLPQLIGDAYGFAAKHEMKASALRRTLVADSLRNVYGIVYDIDGEAASNVQFFLTDSSAHFLRGALYFFNPPNPDSIRPVLEFIRGDITRITQTLQWR